METIQLDIIIKLLTVCIVYNIIEAIRTQSHTLDSVIKNYIAIDVIMICLKIIVDDYQ